MKNIKEVKKALIVVDMVNGFIKEGNMKDKSIENIVPENERLINEFIKEDEGLIFIKDCHQENSIEFKKFPKHCVKGTSEANLVDELLKYEQDALVYEKNSTSAIFAQHFIDDISKMENLSEVVITGCCTDICVSNLAIPLQNYFDENNKEVNIIVPENAVETYDAPYHPRDIYNDMAFKLMNQAGIKLVKKYEKRRGN